MTATLNGRVQSLEADEGERYQVEVLSNAEAWVPSAELPDMDLTSFFLSQQVGYALGIALGRFRKFLSLLLQDTQQGLNKFINS